jgi:4-hydroxy 2-oxovalerate aldolase
MAKDLKVLDCTFRDGGYYNNWKFTKTQEQKYLKSISSSGIQVLELGFRFLKKNQEYGDYAYSKDEKINDLKLEKNIKVAIMINGSDIINRKDIRKLLSPSIKTKVSIIRFACQASDIFSLLDTFEYTKSLGYKVIVNLMQINLVNKNTLIKILSLLKKNVDVFYFADSFGNIDEKKTKSLCKLIKKHWKKEFGIHAHDNCGKAFKNTVVAIKEGASWIDSTILGMGRGAGNLKTEELLLFLNKKYYKKNIYKIKFINNLSKKTFAPLKKIYGWGKSRYYYIAAKNNIHPSYIQLLERDFRYSHKEKVNIINSLKKESSRSFSPEKLNILIQNQILNKGNWNAKNWCINKNLLILGQGNFIKNNKLEITDFAKKNNCIVISININTYYPNQLVDYFISSNQERILLDFDSYKLLKKKIIIPISKYKKILIKKKINFNYLNYGHNIKKNTFKIFPSYCYVPNNLTLSYCLAVAIIGRPKNIFLAGFDGYKNKTLNDEISKTFTLFKKFTNSKNLYSLNKTIFDIKKIYH